VDILCRRGKNSSPHDDGCHGAESGSLCGTAQDASILATFAAYDGYVPSSRYLWSSAPIFCFCKNKYKTSCGVSGVDSDVSHGAWSRSRLVEVREREKKRERMRIYYN